MENKKIRFDVSWEEWKKQLGSAVEYAKELGIDDRTLEGLAQRAGDILAGYVQPANAEQETLKELWDVADQDERRVLAGLMTKLVKKEKMH